MRAYFDERQTMHAPKHFLVQGKLRPSPESPERAAVLREAAQKAGCTVHAPNSYGLAPIEAIHDARYLEFLKTIHARWQALDNAGEEVIPNVHPRSRRDNYPNGVVGQAGYHQADTACPIGPDTWESAYWSAQTALSAAEDIVKGERVSYALCRPPGHHAYHDQAGGFCFLNNSAIAAKNLLEQGLKPVILDVDVHHGNGTQGIFYSRKDVLTISIHADPKDFYPFFWGTAKELGEGVGEGYNLNLPLPRGSGIGPWLDALEVAKGAISDFGADVIVVALGLDAHESDPFRALALKTNDFTTISSRISELKLPMLMVQEGGYLSPDLGPSLTAFLQGVS